MSPPWQLVSNTLHLTRKSPIFILEKKKSRVASEDFAGTVRSFMQILRVSVCHTYTILCIYIDRWDFLVMQTLHTKHFTSI